MYDFFGAKIWSDYDRPGRETRAVFSDWKLLTDEQNFCYITQHVMLFTAKELKKRQGELEWRVKRDEPSEQLPSASTGLTVRNTEAKQPSAQVHIPVPTDTIIAFGDDGKNEIWRRETNKWVYWEKSRDCGYWYACVKAYSNIYIIGGRRRLEDSFQTDIYDISKEQWSKGPQLNVARLGLRSRQLLIPWPVFFRKF